MARGRPPSGLVGKPPGLVCPLCKGPLDVKETRAGLNYFKRTRICHDLKCDGKLVTVEVVCPGKFVMRSDSMVAIPADRLHEMIKLLESVVTGGVSDDE